MLGMYVYLVGLGVRVRVRAGVDEQNVLCMYLCPSQLGFTYTIRFGFEW